MTNRAASAACQAHHKSNALSYNNYRLVYDSSLMHALSITRMFIRTGWLLALVSLQSFRAEGAMAGDVDLSFDSGSGVDAQITAIASQADGKVIIAGQFLTVRGLERRHLARLNPDGSGDPTFNAGTVINTAVSAIAIQPDGKVLIARDYYHWFADPAERKVARLHSDGTLDDSFVPDTGTLPYNSSSFTSLALQPDGKVVLGGYFIDYYVDDQGFGYYYPRSLLIRLHADGSADSTFSRSAGPYNTGSRAHTRISSVALQPDGKIVIGGEIDTRVNGTGRYGLARHYADGSRDHSFDPAVDGHVRSVIVQPDGRILLGGGLIGNFPPRNGLARIHPDGSLDETFHPATHPETVVTSLVRQPDGKLLIDSYRQIDDVRYSRFERLNADGSEDSSFNPGTGPGAPDNSGLVMTSLPDGKIFVAGGFTLFDNISRERIARLNSDGSVDAAFLPGSSINGAVASLVVQPNGKLLLGGNFTSAGGTKRNRVARLHANGEVDAGFDPGTGVDYGSYRLEVTALAARADGGVMIGGDFGTVSGTIRKRLAGLNPNGSLDSGFLPGVGGGGFDPIPVQSILMLSDNRMLIAEPGGVDGLHEPKPVVRLHAGGSVDSTFNADVTGDTGATYAVARKLAVQPDGKVLVAGYFVIVGGGEFDYYEHLLVRLNADGSRDHSFTRPRFWGDSWLHSHSLYSVALQPDGKVLVGGDFLNANGVTRNGIARLNADGTLDTTFNPGAGAVDGEWLASVVAIEVQPDGKILAAGKFTTFNNFRRHGIVRLHTDGSVDTSFIPQTEPDGPARTMALLPDGNVILSSDVTTYNAGGSVRARIVRLYGNSTAPGSYASWAARSGLTGAAAHASADPDFDGLPNSAEYVLGSDPSIPAAAGQPSVTLGGGNLLFTFSRDDPAESPDVTLSVESGSNLVTWPALFTIGANSAASSPGVSITENGTAPDTVTVTIPHTGNTRMYARLKVTILP